MKSEVIYVAIFWDDAEQSVTQVATSGNLHCLLPAANAYLDDLNVPDLDYRVFLKARMADWGGRGSLVTTIENGKLVLFTLPIDRSGAPARFVSV